MSGRARARRGERRRRLGQNFLAPKLADRLVAEAEFRPGDHVLEIGPGAGALTLALLRRGVHVDAIELDPRWARKLQRRIGDSYDSQFRTIEADFRSYPLPDRPFRVVGSLPFSDTTPILSHLLDDPTVPLIRADLVVQWEVAKKRSDEPATTLRSAIWAPWWQFHLGRRIPARNFRPMPRVDGGILSITPRRPAILPPAMYTAYASFMRSTWPFEGRT